MAYDGLTNYIIVQELNKKVINGKIHKIYEPNFDEIILGIYSNGKKYALNLVIQPQYYRANLTTTAKQNPNRAPNFCMTLRKYLLGTHITKIYTKKFERIIFIEFEGFNKAKDFSTKKLVVELMGKHSNIILLDNNEVILDSLKHFSTNSGSYRNIYSGSKYVLPTSEKIDFMDIIDKEEFYRVLTNNSARIGSKSLCNIISSTFTGISKSSILYFENRLNVSDELSNPSSNLLYEYINNILNNVDNVCCVEFDNNYSISLINDLQTKKENNLQVNFFLDDYYTSKETNTTFVNYRNSLLKLILNKLSKLNSKLNLINSKIAECKDAEKYKLYGELITSNLYKIDDYNRDSIELENYYTNEIINIPLDKTITPSANAKKFFKKYKKLKTAKEFVDVQKDSLVCDIDYLENIVSKIENSKNVLELDKFYYELESNNLIKNKGKKNARQNGKKITEKSSLKFGKENIEGQPLKLEIDGFTVLVGKNNKQNDYLTTKIANKDDLWFHVKDFHGSHVILKTNNKVPSQDTINKVARLAKEHSKAKLSSNVQVDYTFIKFVKKPNGSKLGMVIYTNNKSVIVK